MKPSDPFPTSPTHLCHSLDYVTILPLFFPDIYKHTLFYCILLYCSSQMLRFFPNWTQDLPPAKGLWFTLLRYLLYCGGLELSPYYLRGMPLLSWLLIIYILLLLFHDFSSLDIIYWFPIMLSEDLAPYTHCSHFLSSFSQYHHCLLSQ